MYEKRFALSDWPGGLLGECMLDYARHEGIRSIIAVMSNTTDYAKLIRRVNWRTAGMEAILASPVARGSGSGAMVKVPRAQGQALAALINRAFTSSTRQGKPADMVAATHGSYASERIVRATSALA
jgi:hypothetical protein